MDVTCPACLCAPCRHRRDAWLERGLGASAFGLLLACVVFVGGLIARPPFTVAPTERWPDKLLAAEAPVLPELRAPAVPSRDCLRVEDGQPLSWNASSQSLTATEPRTAGLLAFADGPPAPTLLIGWRGEDATCPRCGVLVPSRHGIAGGPPGLLFFRVAGEEVETCERCLAEILLAARPRAW